MSSSKLLTPRPNRQSGQYTQTGLSLLQTLGILMLAGVALAVILKQWA